MKIFEHLNRGIFEHRNGMPKEIEDGFHVILPMLDKGYLDSVFRISGGDLIWKLEPDGSYGNNYMRGSPYTRDNIPSVAHLYPTNNEFLSELERNHPQDLEFFIWHPEVFEGRWNE